MEIHKNQVGNAMEIAIVGKLDTMTAPELEAELNTLPADVAALTFNFAQLVYVSSAGLRVLLRFYKKMNGQGSMKLIHVNESIMEVLEVTGFTDFLTIE